MNTHRGVTAREVCALYRGVEGGELCEHSQRGVTGGEVCAFTEVSPEGRCVNTHRGVTPGPHSPDY